MNEKEMKVLHENAIRLIEGGVVQAEGLFLKAVLYDGDDYPCSECEMDSLCHWGVIIWRLCEECNSITEKKYYLTFNKKKRS